MKFVTYENRRNPHVTIHLADCRQLRKNGGTHKYGQGGYRDHETLADANNYADTTGLPKSDCSFCVPQHAAP